MRLRVLVPALLLLLATPATGSASGDHVDTDELFQILPWDPLSTITEPAFNPRPPVSPYEEVFGVALGGEAHAYPEKLMRYHEVINDVVGGVPIVVAYCPLCGVALAYERTVEGEVLTFRTSGFLYRNNKVMFDVETGSLWPLLLGEAINGTYHGTPLRPVNAERLPFRDWTALHPDTKVVARPWGSYLCPSPCPQPPGFQGYDVDPYGAYRGSNDTYAPVHHPDRRLHPKTFVVGVVRAGEAWAFPHPLLLEERAVNVVVGGTPIVVALKAAELIPGFNVTSAHVYLRGDATFAVDRETNELVAPSGERYALLTGEGATGRLEPVDFFYGFWFAWKDFHPETCLYGDDCGPSPFPWPLILGIGAAIGVAVALVRWRVRRER